VKSLKFEFDSEGKGKQAKKQINDNILAVKGEDEADEQENEIVLRSEIKDELKEFLPEDNLGTVEEQAETKETEIKKLRVEDVKTANDLKEVIPFSSSHVIKDIARNPFVARVILYLEEHGYSNYSELHEALGISDGSLWFTFDKLKKIVFPVIKINKAEQFNKHITYYDLKRSEQLAKDLKELRVWYEYYSLKAFLKALPEFKWVDLNELNKDCNFRILIKRYGFDFNKAIQLLLRNGVVHVKGQGENFTHIKRVFDNFGTRISEIEARDLIGS